MDAVNSLPISVEAGTDDYLSLVLSYPNLEPISLLTLFFLALFRLAPIVSLAPFLGSKLPGGVKIGLAIALAVILLPHIIATHTTPVSFDMNFVRYSLKEVVIGLFLALMAAIPFFMAESAGVLIDFLRGSSSLMINSPVTQTQVSPIGLLYNYVLIVLFFQIDGPYYFLDAVLQSYTMIPADRMLNPDFFAFRQPVWQAIWGLLNQFTAISIQLAAPSLVAILMGEMFLGIANRMAPQVQFAFLGISIKSLLGIALLWAGWFFILQQMGKQSLIFVQSLMKLLHTITT